MAIDNGMMPISATRAEVMAQPQVIGRVLREQQDQVQALADTLARRETNLVLASGSGDSWFAAQAVRLAWERYAGVPFEALQAYEYAAYDRPAVDARTAHFIISSSGRPTTTWDALDRALESPALVVGITDNPAADNPFVNRPHVALVPGAHKAGWPAQTTTAAIALLAALAIAFGEARNHLASDEAARRMAELETVPQQMADVLARSESWAARVAASLRDQRTFMLVGSGPSYAVAQTGSALLAEGPQEFGLALTAEEFHHALRIATVRPGEAVLLIAPDGAAATRCYDTARSLRAWGATLIPLVMPGTASLLEGSDLGLQLPHVDEPLSPLLTLLPLHALSIALAEQKVATGYQRPRPSGRAAAVP